MEINIAVIPGDGIGPEITEATEQVLKRVCEIYGHVLNITHVKACSSSIEETGEPLPKESLKKCLQADAVLLGNTGLEKYKNEPLTKRPEYALLKLRKELGVTTNLRPVRLYPALMELSPLNKNTLSGGLDYLFVRDIAGGVLFKMGMPANVKGFGYIVDSVLLLEEDSKIKTTYLYFKVAQQNIREQGQARQFMYTMKRAKKF